MIGAGNIGGLKSSWDCGYFNKNEKRLAWIEQEVGHHRWLYVSPAEIAEIAEISKGTQIPQISQIWAIIDGYMSVPQKLQK